MKLVILSWSEKFHPVFAYSAQLLLYFFGAGQSIVSVYFCLFAKTYCCSVPVGIE